MAEDTPAAPAPISADDLQRAIAMLQPPSATMQAPQTDSPGAHGFAGFIGDVGNVLAGGPSGLLGLGPDADASAGRKALLNFGINMLMNSGPSYEPRGFGQILASGLQGAQASRAGSEETAYHALGAQQQLAQQAFQNRLSAIKEALPLLRMQQLANLPNPLAGSKGSITAAADEFSPDKATALKQIAQRESQGDPTALNYVAREDPTAYERGATASGKYQIVNSTWNEGKQLAGVDAAQYPTARDAPEAVQDKVASALYDKYGTKPWQKGAKDWVKDEQGRYQLATVRPPAGSPGGAPAKAPTAPATPPGVQVGGAPPPPPGGSTVAAGPSAVGGIGAALNPPSAIKGSPVPAGKLLPKTADAVGAIVAGMEGARTGPQPPTALTAGPGAPTQTATATPNAPEAGWGSKIPSGYSDSPTVTAPAAAPAAATTSPSATTTVPAAPTPLPFPGYMSIEDWRTQHPTTIDASLYKVPQPDVADAQKEKAAASQALAVANASGGDTTKAIERYTAASQNLAKLQQDAAAKSLELRQKAQADADSNARQLYDAEMERRRQIAKDQAALQQTAAENEKNRQNQIDLKNIEAQNTRETNRDQVVNVANQKGLEQAQTDYGNARDVGSQLQGFSAMTEGIGQPGWMNTTKFPGSDHTIAEQLQQMGILGDDQKAQVAGAQLLRGGIANLVKTLRAGMPMGSLSDRDLNFIERLGPTEWMDRDTRAAAVGYLRQAYKAKQDFSFNVIRGLSAHMNYDEAIAAADAKAKPMVPTVPPDLTEHWLDDTGDWKARRNKWASQNDVVPGTLIHMADGAIHVVRGPTKQQGQR